jgi:hypothetical protein
MAGKKTSIYLTDEDSARLDAVHKAMRTAPSLREFDLKWSDTLRLLLRRALAVAELEYLHKIPEDADPEEWREFLYEDHQKQDAILRTLVDKGWAETKITTGGRRILSKDGRTFLEPEPEAPPKKRRSTKGAPKKNDGE